MARGDFCLFVLIVAQYRDCSNIHIIQPLNYTMMISLLQHTTLLITDSGGLQEEAAAFGVPTFTMRLATERQEGVEAGVIRLVPPNGKAVEAALRCVASSQRMHFVSCSITVAVIC